MSHFTWQAGFAVDCPMCGAHIPAGVQHECFPQPLTEPRPTLGKALALALQDVPRACVGEEGGTQK